MKLKRLALLKTVAYATIATGTLLALLNLKEVYLILWETGTYGHAQALAVSMVGWLLMIIGLIMVAIAKAFDNDGPRDDI